MHVSGYVMQMPARGRHSFVPGKLTPAKKKRRSRRKRGTGQPQQPQHTSTSTSRAAYTETRRWLLERHGPVCAYCGGRFAAKGMTLDHVAPRRGLSAYDRRDNLVLACKGCNTAKADMPLLAFLLRRRDRAHALVRYGDHLSEPLLDLVRPIAARLNGGSATPTNGAAALPPADEHSPYRDVGYREPAKPVRELPDEGSPYSD